MRMLVSCRSQDKGFHVAKALLHVFTHSLPYVSAGTLKVEELVEGEKVQFNMPAELSDYMFRYCIAKALTLFAYETTNAQKVT